MESQPRRSFLKKAAATTAGLATMELCAMTDSAIAGSVDRADHLASAKVHPTEPVSIDLGRQLLVDDWLIDETSLKRTFHKPRIHPASPVLKPETPIELNNGIMPAACPFSDGVLYDPKDKLFKMWYIAGYDDGFCYATSEDGIQWQRPQLDVVPGTNRVLAPIPGYIRNGSTVWLDHEANDPSQRFKMFAYYRMGNGLWPRMKIPEPRPTNYGMGYAYTSPDGIHWSAPVKTGPCGDNSGMFYNPFRKMWTYNIRTRHPKYNRVRSYREHPDFLEGAPWTKQDVIFWLAADDLDLPDPVLKYKPQLYKVDCVAYESRMLGLFAMFFGPPNTITYAEGFPKTNDLMVGFSHDGLKWERPDRTAFIPCSRQKGTWNRGYMHSAGGVCLIVGDEIWFYVSGFSGESPKQGGGVYAGGSTGLTILRRDGFASMDAGGETGTLTTRPITFQGKHLFVNLDAPQGELRAEMLDESGQVIEPFTKSNSIPMRNDSTRSRLMWKNVTDLAGLIGESVRFRFHLANGRLYAFWVSPDLSGASYGYVASGGPGLSGATDTIGGSGT